MMIRPVAARPDAADDRREKVEKAVESEGL